MTEKEMEENYRRRILSEGGVATAGKRTGTGMSLGELLEKKGIKESFEKEFEKHRKENEKYKYKRKK